MIFSVNIIAILIWVPPIHVKSALPCKQPPMKTRKCMCLHTACIVFIFFVDSPRSWKPKIKEKHLVNLVIRIYQLLSTSSQRATWLQGWIMLDPRLPLVSLHTTVPGLTKSDKSSFKRTCTAKTIPIRHVADVFCAWQPCSIQHSLSPHFDLVVDDTFEPFWKHHPFWSISNPVWWIQPKCLIHFEPQKRIKTHLQLGDPKTPVGSPRLLGCAQGQAAQPRGIAPGPGRDRAGSTWDGGACGRKTRPSDRNPNFIIIKKIPYLIIWMCFIMKLLWLITCEVDVDECWIWKDEDEDVDDDAGYGVKLLKESQTVGATGVLIRTCTRQRRKNDLAQPEITGMTVNFRKSPISFRLRKGESRHSWTGGGATKYSVLSARAVPTMWCEANWANQLTRENGPQKGPQFCQLSKAQLKKWQKCPKVTSSSQLGLWFKFHKFGHTNQVTAFALIFGSKSLIILTRCRCFLRCFQLLLPFLRPGLDLRQVDLWRRGAQGINVLHLFLAEEPGAKCGSQIHDIQKWMCFHYCSLWMSWKVENLNLIDAFDHYMFECLAKKHATGK